METIPEKRRRPPPPTPLQVSRVYSVHGAPEAFPSEPFGSPDLPAAGSTTRRFRPVSRPALVPRSGPDRRNRRGRLKGERRDRAAFREDAVVFGDACVTVVATRTPSCVQSTSASTPAGYRREASPNELSRAAFASTCLQKAMQRGSSLLRLSPGARSVADDNLDYFVPKPPLHLAKLTSGSLLISGDAESAFFSGIKKKPNRLLPHQPVGQEWFFSFLNYLLKVPTQSLCFV